MGLFFSKNKNGSEPNIAELQDRLNRLDEEKRFYFDTVRGLLVFIKQFPLYSKEIDTNGFTRQIDDLTDDLMSDKKVGHKESVYEKSKKQILSFIGRYKLYLEDREKEFKEIISLLTKAMADLGVENQDYNEKIRKKTDRIESLTELDDIKIIKNSIKQEVAEIRTAVSEKQKKDTLQISILSEKVHLLEEELRKAESKSQRDGLTLVGRADKALYRAKNSGKNRVVSEKEL